MKALALFIICPFLLLISTAETNAQIKPDSVLESKIARMIFNLREVKLADVYVVKHSHNKRQLSVCIYQQPDKKGGDYWVKVWEDNGYTYHTHFNFFVNSKTLAIRYMDVVTGDDIPLEVLRKDKKRHKMLEYK